MKTTLQKKTLSKRYLVLLFFNIFYLVMRHLTVSGNWIIADLNRAPILPAILKVLFEILSILFLMLLAASRNQNRKLEPFWIRIFISLPLLLVASSFVALAGPYSISPVQIISALRSWMIWLTPFLLGVFFFRISDLFKLQTIVVFIAFLQVPIAILQFFSNRISADYITGLMGAYGSGIFAIVQVIASTSLLISYIKGRISTLVFIPSVIILFIPVVLARAMIVFIILPIAWTYAISLLRGKRKHIRKYLVIMLSLLAAVFILSQFYTVQVRSLDKNPFEVVFHDISYVLSPDLSQGQRTTRTYYLLSVINGLVVSPASLLLGYGTGLASTSRISDYSRVSLVPDSIGSESLFVSVLVENGILGCLFILLFLAGLFINLKKIQSKVNQEAEIEVVNIGFVMVALFSLLIFYNKSFTSGPIVWLFMTQFGIFVQWSTKLHRIKRPDYGC